MNNNVRFKCPCGNAVFFKPMDGNPNVTASGANILLDDCGLTLIGAPHPGQCPLTINPATGTPPGLCENPQISGSWNTGAAGHVTVSGKHPLNSRSFIQCSRQSIIRPFAPTYQSITVDNNVATISVRCGVSNADADGTPRKDTGGTCRNGTAPGRSDNVMQRESGGAMQEPEKLQSMVPGEKDAPQEGVETCSEQYTLCGMDQGDACKDCAYRKTTHKLKEENEGRNAGELKKNMMAIPFLERYIMEFGAIETLIFESEKPDPNGPDFTYSAAHHHLIPVNQCFKGHESLVKLANYYGYDINSAVNGICLPSAADGYQKQSIERQREIAFRAMKELKLQWHVGPHQTSIPEAAAVRLARPFRSYKTEVDAILDQFINKNFRKTGCRAQSFERKAEKFRCDMDAVCERIRARLMKFSVNPRDHACIYVSKMSFYYAFYNELREYQDILFKKAEAGEVADHESDIL